MKYISIQYNISIFSGPYFPVFRVNTEDMVYLSVFSPNSGKYVPEEVRMRTLFTQCELDGYS